MVSFWSFWDSWWSKKQKNRLNKLWILYLGENHGSSFVYSELFLSSTSKTICWPFLVWLTQTQHHLPEPFIVPYRSTEFWGDPNHLFGDIWINATWKKNIYAICVSVYRDIHVFCLLFWYTGCLKNRYPKIQSLITLVPQKKHVLIYWDRHPVFCLDLEWGTQNVIVGHHVLSWLIIMFHIKIAIWRLGGIPSSNPTCNWKSCIYNLKMMFQFKTLICRGYPIFRRTQVVRPQSQFSPHGTTPSTRRRLAPPLHIETA